MLASLVRYFLPFALDKYSVLRWQVFRKKEKTLVMMLFKIVGLMVWAIYLIFCCSFITIRVCAFIISCYYFKHC